MEISFTQSALKDYKYWKRTDPRKVERIAKLCKDVLRHPTTGMGKPEPLKFDLQGCWSRRIDRTRRLVYRIEEDQIVIISCRYHY